MNKNNEIPRNTKIFIYYFLIKKNNIYPHTHAHTHIHVHRYIFMNKSGKKMVFTYFSKNFIELKVNSIAFRYNCPIKNNQKQEQRLIRILVIPIIVMDRL